MTYEAHELRIEMDREDDGRWIAEIIDLPGVMAYGSTEDEARHLAIALALRVIADKIEHHEEFPRGVARLFAAA